MKNEAGEYLRLADPDNLRIGPSHRNCRGRRQGPHAGGR